MLVPSPTTRYQSATRGTASGCPLGCQPGPLETRTCTWRAGAAAGFAIPVLLVLILVLDLLGMCTATLRFGRRGSPRPVWLGCASLLLLLFLSLFHQALFLVTKYAAAPILVSLALDRIIRLAAHLTTETFASRRRAAGGRKQRREAARQQQAEEPQAGT